LQFPLLNIEPRLAEHTTKDGLHQLKTLRGTTPLAARSVDEIHFQQTANRAQTLTGRLRSLARRTSFACWVSPLPNRTADPLSLTASFRETEAGPDIEPAPRAFAVSDVE
jgi:hypothetical protein